jgi:hypothetical protein
LPWVRARTAPIQLDSLLALPRRARSHLWSDQDTVDLSSEGTGTSYSCGRTSGPHLRPERSKKENGTSLAQRLLQVKKLHLWETPRRDQVPLSVCVANTLVNQTRHEAPYIFRLDAMLRE